MGCAQQSFICWVCGDESKIEGCARCAKPKGGSVNSFFNPFFQPSIIGIVERKSMYSRTLKSVLLVLALACSAFLPMGCKKAPPITLACNASAPAVYPGDALTVTATAGSVDTKKNTNVLYSWSGDGVTGNGTSATVNTASLAPGSYTAKADVKEGKKGKEGLKPGQSAKCSASYAVKQFGRRRSVARPAPAPSSRATRRPLRRWA